MGKKKASIIVFMLLLLTIGMLSLAFNTQSVKSEWTGTVYIRADGSIDPPDAPIITYDNITYTLTDNITSSGDGIVVERDSIVVDGAGYTLQGNGTGNGFDLSVINVTVENVNIRGFENGFFIAGFHNIVLENNITNNNNGVRLHWLSSQNAISENNVRDNDYGICLSSSSKNNISHNVVTNNSVYGIYLSCSPENNIFNNIITNNGEYGLKIAPFSTNNNLSGNILNDNRYNFGVYGYAVEDFIHSIDDSNSVNGKPVYYLVNRSDLVINSVTWPQVGYLGLVNCNNITLEGLTITNNGQGLLLVNTNNSRATDNNLTDNSDYGVYLYQSFNNLLYRNNAANSDHGIYFTYSSNNNVSNNDITINHNGIYLYGAFNNMIHMNNITHNGVGIKLRFSTNNTIHGNLVKNNSGVGINLFESSNYNSISGNNVANNGAGIALGESVNNTVFNNNVTNHEHSTGVSLASSFYNNIFWNKIANNVWGVYLTRSSNNTIFENNIMSNDCGIWLSDSSNNSIYHNNFINNAYHFSTYGYVNVWDDGYPSGGNYWSYYYSIDVKSGPNQDLPGSDGIGDEPYVSDQYNQDRYPLTAPINIFDVGVWDETEYFVDIISNSTVSDFYFNPDEGAFLKFNVTGDNGTAGFCRVTIPKDLLWVEDGWTVLVGGEPVNYTIIPDENYTYLYFTYNHSTKTVEIQGTNVIPEFPSSITLLGFLMLITIPLIFAKKKRLKKANS